MWLCVIICPCYCIAHADLNWVWCECTGGLLRSAENYGNAGSSTATTSSACCPCCVSGVGCGSACYITACYITGVSLYHRQGLVLCGRLCCSFCCISCSAFCYVSCGSGVCHR